MMSNTELDTCPGKFATLRRYFAILFYLLKIEKIEDDETNLLC